MPSTRTPTPPSSSFPASRRTTCSPSRPTSPSLLDRCARLPWHNVPELDRDRGHGRIELRTPKGGLGPPLRVPARRPGRPGQPCPARRPPAGHWEIDNGPALRPRRDLRRGCLPGPRGHHPAGHGQPGQSRHRHPPPAGPLQHRRRAAPQRRDATRVLPFLGITPAVRLRVTAGSAEVVRLDRLGGVNHEYGRGA